MSTPTFRFIPALARQIMAGRKAQTRRIKTGDTCPYGPVDSVRPLATNWAVHADFDPVRPAVMDPEVMRAEGFWHAGLGVKKPAWAGKLRPPMFLPRQLYPLMPQIRTVTFRRERLADMSAADALAEGLTRVTKDAGRTWKYGMADTDGWPGRDNDGWNWSDWDVDHRAAFARLWDPINAPRGFSFASNAVVWVVTFELAKA